MIKVGVIGLGNIAQKAYLPVYSELQDRFEWHLSSRNAEKLAHIQKQFGFQYGSTNSDELITEGVEAVFVHTPTATHYDIINDSRNRYHAILNGFRNGRICRWPTNPTGR